MKEDYLWDKTGSDSEIEKLENALKVFRHKENAPLEVPTKVVSFPVRSRRTGFRFALAAAACLAFGVISFGVWFQILRNNMDAEIKAGRAVQPQGTAAPADSSFPSKTVSVQRPAISRVTKAANAKQTSERKFVKARQSSQAIARQPDLKIQAAKRAKPALSLTEEEIYAYNQLMLALSITSSKLKLVKEKVEGMED